MNIQNSTAIVTGANRGIGKAFVQTLLERGAKRVYATARKVSTLEDIVALDSNRVVPLTLDITDRKQVASVANQTRDVNLLINNAGVLAVGSLLEAPLELVMRDVDTNYFGTLNMVRAFAPVLESNGGGSIVNLLTIVALASMPGIGAYNASKAAAWSLTQSVRAELSKKGIQVHGVYPGAVDTDMIRDFQMPKTSPQEIAQAALNGVETGLEDIFPDAMSQQFYAGWQQDHKAVEHQFGSM
jgi:NAD(P)-dependent dehydrogenase (short-subunit alcohol dehydrogenase family)